MKITVFSGYGFAIQQVVHSVVPSTKRQNGEQPQKMAQFMKTAAPRFQKFVKIVAILYSNRAQAHLNLNQYLKVTSISIPFFAYFSYFWDSFRLLMMLMQLQSLILLCLKLSTEKELLH